MVDLSRLIVTSRTVIYQKTGVIAWVGAEDQLNDSTGAEIDRMGQSPGWYLKDGPSIAVDINGRLSNRRIRPGWCRRRLAG